MQAGAIIGLLTVLGWDLAMYATTNMGDITMAFTDVIVVGIMSAAVGGAIGWYLGRK
ncbi:MAG: hypothetical protein IPL46_17470 [Saprospiraceae bacterium]|nr:hypothetical protein [Saprospiraceae bacterium]